MGYDSSVRASALLQDPAAVAIVDRYVPGALDSPLLRYLSSMRLGGIVRGALFAGETPPNLTPMWEELEALPGEMARDTTRRVPRTASGMYEDESVARGSAHLQQIDNAEQWAPVEITINGPSHGNPFVDVDLWADLSTDGQEPTRVHGFYDGAGTYHIRFAPPQSGSWRFTTGSTARSLDGISGEFTAEPAHSTHGPVRVAETFHFRHDDGTRFLPVGTTLYAWTHQPDHIRAATLRTLEEAPFNKVRMCVFPKSYLFNTEEPELYPYELDAEGQWDFSRFNPAFFRQLDGAVADLGRLGIEADVILFHVYDRWGFAEMPAWADDLFVRYVVRRLAASPNVWWSLANEYDLVASKSLDDWERIAAIITEEDPVGHLASIHNCFAFYDYSKPWITHASIQRIDVYRTAENTDLWRAEWTKPVVIDECGYEGDIDQGWGNLTGEEVVRRAWEAAVRGGYFTHGETYLNLEECLWWSKGGELVGSSPARLGFLQELIRQAPSGVLEPLPGEWDAHWAGDDDYRIVYLGFSRPAYRDVRLRPNTRWEIDVIDTWNMTIETLPGNFEDRVHVPLPARQYMAIRFRRVITD